MQFVQIKLCNLLVWGFNWAGENPGNQMFCFLQKSGQASIVQGRYGPPSDENERHFRFPFFLPGESRVLRACAVRNRTGIVSTPGNQRGDFHARLRHSRWTRADLEPACWTCRPRWAPAEFRRFATVEPGAGWLRPATSSKGGCEPLCPNHNPLPGRTGMAASRQVEKLYRRHTAVRRASEACDTRKLGVPALEGSAVSQSKCPQARLGTMKRSGALVLRGLTKAQYAIDTKRVRLELAKRKPAPVSASGRVLPARSAQRPSCCSL